jgi:hypothetical protein
MPDIPVEQAVYHRTAAMAPSLVARSAGFADAWLPEIERLLRDFGDRPPGVPCPMATFAQPLGEDQAAIVQVADQGAALAFHVLVLPRAPYRAFLGDPFVVADHFPPPWTAAGTLKALSLPAQPSPPPTVADVRRVLQRVKAGALREGQDPAAAELTPENAESPALLGGLQVLVDGGKLVFVRPGPDPGLIRGLWMLLPHAARRDLWPATFAFSNACRFDALVVPRRAEDEYAGYTTEEQAADYPPGHYELSLQTAAEAGDQQALAHLFTRRSSGDTLRLAVVMVIVSTLVVLGLRFWEPGSPRPADEVRLFPAERERVANAAAVAGCADPWTSVALIEFGKFRQAERVAAAAGIVACQEPWTAVVQSRAAYGRFVEIWKPAAQQ